MQLPVFNLLTVNILHAIERCYQGMLISSFFVSQLDRLIIRVAYWNSIIWSYNNMRPIYCTCNDSRQEHFLAIFVSWLRNVATE